MKLLLLIGLGVVGWFWWLGRRAGGPMRRDEARRLLDLPADADAGQVREAHRRLIARVHPDAGGSAALAARVNAARDALLADLGA